MTEYAIPAECVSNYLNEGFFDFYEHTRSHPPQFPPYVIESGSKKLTIQFIGESEDEVRNTINSDLDFSEFWYLSFVYLKISPKSGKRKDAIVYARIERPRLRSFYESVKEAHQQSFHPFEKLITKFYEHIGDPKKFLSRYRFRELSNNQLIFEGIDDPNSYIAYSLDSLMPTPPIPFTPGETHALKDWCYDPKITPQSPTPGAFVSLSYRHQHTNGELNSLPWRLSIKNYTLTPTEQGVIHTKEKAEHILLTDDMILNIDAFLEECSLRYEAYHYFLYDCERILMMQS